MKTMILRVIKPSPLTWLFLALLVLAQVSFCTRTLFNEPSLSTTQYGIGNPVEIFYRDGSRQGVHVGWTALVLLTGTVLAQGPEPQHSDPYWQVSYWNNISLSGAPAREETVERIDYDWGYGSPHHTVAVEGFSARWERTVNVAEGRYRFSVTSDDGIRVYVDDQAIVNEWHDHPAQTYSADISLQAGHHLIAVEYYENTGLAVAKVSWEPIAETDTWRGQYYDNQWLNGAPVLTRKDARIAFHWGQGSPAPGIPGDNFGVRWARAVPFQAGQYRFTATSDDGIRVTVDQRPIIDEWHDHSVRSYMTELNLAAGYHEIVVEYYEHKDFASARLEWQQLSAGIETWQGEYYDNRWLSGSPILTRDEENINHDWGYGSPAEQIPSDGFSARWTRTAHLDSGLYRFTTTSDDGVRLWVDNHLLIDAWYDQASQSHSGRMFVTGEIPIVIEYYENSGVASVRLAWARIGDGPPQPAPGEVIVDDSCDL